MFAYMNGVTGYIGGAMDEPPFSLAFVMVKESFVVPAIFFYLAATLTKTTPYFNPFLPTLTKRFCD